MVEESLRIEEVVIAEVTEWMRQNLSEVVVAEVALLQMHLQRLDWVEPLLTNEHSSALQTHLTKCFLVLCLHVSL